MIVTRLRGFRWGKHDEFDYDCNGSIVGILGPNGSGKTTILTLLEFLINGQTRDDLDTYVKDFTGNGGGEMWFQKYGKQGYIMRQVGTTSKRKLEWDGKTYTKAAEVDKIMSEIFGADKKALANSVFVNQGTLEDILFKEKDTERRRAFIQLVNLSYCATRAGQVEEQIKRLGAGLVDLTPARDEAIMAKNTAEASLAAIDADLARYPDYSEWLALLRLRAAATANLALLQTQLGDLQLQRGIKQTEFDSSRDNLEISDHEAYLSDLETQHATKTVEVNTYRGTYNELTHYKNLQEKINTARTSMATWGTKLNALNPEKLTQTQLNERLEALRTSIQQHEKYLELQPRLEAKALEHQLLITERGALERPVGASAITAIEAELVKIRGQVGVLEKYAKAQAKISRCMGEACPDRAECTECGLTLANPVELSPDELTIKAQMLQELKDRAKQLDAELTTKRTTLWHYQSETKRLDQLIIRTQKDVDALDAERSKYALFASAGTAYEDLKLLQASQEAISEATRERDRFQTELLTLMASQTNYPLAQANWVSRNHFTAAQLQVLVNDQQKLATDITNARQNLTIIRGHKTQLDACDRSISEKQAALNQLGREVNAELPDGLPPEDKALDQFELEMTASEQTRVGLQASRVTAANNYRDCNVRYQDICTRMEENAAKVDLIRDLRTLRDLLCDEGLPLAFVKHRFDQLTVHTQEALTKMNADFYVGADINKPLEFSFHRLDMANQVELPMNKLSGGQRVRLCISFLTALQKVLIKDVGLLVLDEPLVHTDENGQDQIVAFLSDMRQELKNAEHQIWIVDHNPKVVTALDKQLRLN